jgi:hypothetical protein
MSTAKSILSIALPSDSRWSVLNVDAGTNRYGSLWLCECTCGTIRTTNARFVLNGRSLSCGCLRTERRIAKLTKHGHTTLAQNKMSPEYTAWHGLIARCFYRSHPNYRDYGGRGITVYPEWIGPDGFVKFLAYIGLRPSANHSIDRYPNRTGNYEPGNIRWATAGEQMRNTSRTHFVTVGDKTLCLTDWAVETGISLGGIYRRLEHGYSEEEAVSLPVGARRRQKRGPYKKKVPL